MQKTKLLPGTTKPKLSDLLQRRGQTLEAYAAELGIKHDTALEMHCVMQGVQKDLVILEKLEPSKPVEAPEKLPEEPAKRRRPKNALVDLTTLVHKGTGGSTEDEG